METLDKAGPVPLYHQLKALLQRHIDEGGWKPNDRLPTETELSARYNVSKITVRQALTELVQMGYVRREQGRGTFVAEPKLEQGPRELTSFSEEMRRHGLKAASKVLERKVVPANEDLVENLQVEPGASVFVLKRLRLADAEPMGVQTAHIPLDLAPGLEREKFSNVSLYEVLQSQYGLYATAARETHYATGVDAENAAILRVPVNSPALSAERVTFLASGRPLEYVTSVMRGDRYRIVLDLVRQRG